MNKPTIAALHAGMAAVQSGKVAPGRVWIVRKRPNGTVERRQVDARAYQRQRKAATAAENTALPARRKMGVSQDRFAELLGISPATVRNIEQGRTKPTGPTSTLLRIAEHHPEIFVSYKADRHAAKAMRDEVPSLGKVKLGEKRTPAMKSPMPRRGVRATTTRSGRKSTAAAKS